MKLYAMHWNEPSLHALTGVDRSARGVSACADERSPMTEPQVTLDPHGSSPVEEKLHDALEDQLTSALRAGLSHAERFACSGPTS